MKKRKTKKTAFAIVILSLLAFFFLVKNYMPKQEQSPGLSEEYLENPYGGYPVHPVMEDCEKLTNPINKSFCIGDVAEIEKNSSICMKIEDWEIGTFCLARTTTNKTLCDELIDKELKKECLRYITDFLGLP